MDYRETNRQVIPVFRAGDPLPGMHRERLLLLTTTGRRTGDAHTTPMMFHREEGSPPYAATASVLEGEDRAAVWARIAELYPFFVDHQTKAPREIPVVELTPA